MLGKGGVNSRPGSYGVPDGEWTDGPGFSLCAVPLESFGPVFQDERGDGMTSGGPGYTRPELAEGVTAGRGVEQMILMASSNYGTGLEG